MDSIRSKEQYAEFMKDIKLNAEWPEETLVAPVVENPCMALPKDWGMSVPLITKKIQEVHNLMASTFVTDAKKAIGTVARRPKGKEIIVLVDGDLVAYRCAAATNGVSYTLEIPVAGKASATKEFKYHKEAVKHQKDLEAGGYVGLKLHKNIKPEPSEKAIANMRSIMRCAQQDLEEKLKRPVTFEVFLTSDNLFRTDISPTYKVSRENVERPANLKVCKEYLTTFYGAETVAGYEADDLMVIRAGELKKADRVIMSLDKDLRQMAGQHYDFAKQNLYDVSNEGAMRNFWTQALVGDKTDDIPGIYGIGPVKARKILNDVPPNSSHWAYYKRVVEAWMDHTPREEKETKRAFTTRVMGQLGTSCRLLWLSRELGDLWDAPVPDEAPTVLIHKGEVTVTSDTTLGTTTGTATVSVTTSG